MYTLRPYQQEAVDAGLAFFNGRKKENGIEILPTAAGKSLIIAGIARGLEGNTIVFQPSQEILMQNFNKLRSYGIEDCSIYSASLKTKEISRITFATMGSVSSHMEDFRQFRNVIVDECHRDVNPKEGRFLRFIEDANRKILGVTATPYRLASTSRPIFNQRGEVERDMFGDPVMERGCILRFLTRTSPRVFSRVVYLCQVSDLYNQGYLSPLTYHDVTPSGLVHSAIPRNTTGMGFSDSGVESTFNYFDIYTLLTKVVRRLCARADRHHILVFTQNLRQAEMLSRSVPGCGVVTGETKKKDRERILEDFKAGRIRVLANCQILTTGFDFPELDTVVIARPTMSLASYYQIVGRAIRLSEGKDAWIVDLCGNIRRFGRVEHLTVGMYDNNKYAVLGWIGDHWQQLTNVFM